MAASSPEYDDKKSFEFRENVYYRYNEAYMFYLKQRGLYSGKAKYKEGVQHFVTLELRVVYTDKSYDLIEKWDNLEQEY